MAKIKVRNKREKISPGGIVTLPVAARKALGFNVGQGARVTVAVKSGAVHLAPAGKTGGFRVSPRGQLELRGDAREALEAGVERHFTIDADDASKSVVLRPYS